MKASRAVVIRWFSLGLIKFISNYLPYFEKINIFFNTITKKVWLVCTNYWEFWIWEVRSDQTRSIASWTERISNTAHNTTYCELTLYQNSSRWLFVTIFVESIMLIQEWIRYEEDLKLIFPNSDIKLLLSSRGVYNLIEVISSWTEQELRSILKCSWLKILFKLIQNVQIL